MYICMYHMSLYVCIYNTLSGQYDIMLCLRSEVSKDRSVAHVQNLISHMPLCRAGRGP